MLVIFRQAGRHFARPVIRQAYGFQLLAHGGDVLAKEAIERLAVEHPELGPAEAASIVVVTLVLTYFTLVFGELAPKRIAMQRAERWSLVMARPLAALSAGARPAVALLSASTDLTVRLAGLDPEEQRPEVTEEELKGLITHIAFYAGWPTAVNAGRVALDVFGPK